eukprot:g8535.t1
MKRSCLSALVGVSFLSLTVSGCKKGPGELFGTLGGAAAGAAVGSQFGKGSGNVAMIALMTLGGALLGGHVGSQFDQEEQKQVGETFNNAMASGQPQTWQGRDHKSVNIRPAPHAMESDQGVAYRPFEQTVRLGTSTENVVKWARRAPGGAWEVVPADRVPQVVKNSYYPPR